MHCNYNNEDQTRYKNKMWRDKIKNKINSINNSKPNTLQSKERRPNLNQQTNNQTSLFVCFVIASVFF